MALSPEQEREWTTKLKNMGVTQAKLLWNRGEISPAYRYITSTWIADEERQAEGRAQALQSEQMELMKRSSVAAERQAIAAKRANARASFALFIAAVSLIVSIFALFKH